MNNYAEIPAVDDEQKAELGRILAEGESYSIELPPEIKESNRSARLFGAIELCFGGSPLAGPCSTSSGCV